jgi:hypothetical protein
MIMAPVVARLTTVVVLRGRTGVQTRTWLASPKGMVSLPSNCLGVIPALDFATHEQKNTITDACKTDRRAFQSTATESAAVDGRQIHSFGRGQAGVGGSECCQGQIAR